MERFTDPVGVAVPPLRVTVTVQLDTSPITIGLSQLSVVVLEFFTTISSVIVNVESLALVLYGYEGQESFLYAIMDKSYDPAVVGAVNVKFAAVFGSV